MSAGNDFTKAQGSWEGNQAAVAFFFNGVFFIMNAFAD